MRNPDARLRSQGYDFICGVDEVGRGPLAGPVTAAAVILPGDVGRNGIRDSKLLSHTKREELAEKIKSIAVAWAIESVEPEVIDRINILQAALRAMRAAVLRLSVTPGVVLVDGNSRIPDIGIEQRTIVGGDALSISIGAASIIAKVERDRLMTEYHSAFPQYNFKRNKGYPTREHRLAIHLHGPCDLHRKSFKLLPDGVVQGMLSLER